MDVITFNQRFPKLYHLTFASNLAGIQEHGLQSAKDLADLHSFDPEERGATLGTRRRCIQTMHEVTIRDQHAAHERKMQSCLAKITIAEWLDLLNSKIFFFLSRQKAEQLAHVYGGYEQLLLEVDTTSLLSNYARHVTLCRINSGSFLYNPRPRGRDSFIPLSTYIYKNKRDTPAELTVDRSIPNVSNMSTYSTIAALSGALPSALSWPIKSAISSKSPLM